MKITLIAILSLAICLTVAMLLPQGTAGCNVHNIRALGVSADIVTNHFYTYVECVK